MYLRGALAGILLMSSMSACTNGKSAGSSEVVAPDNDAIKVPDAPGVAGTTPDKIAGEGTAAPQAALQSPDKKEKLATTATTSSELNVRKGPGMSQEVVRILKKGEKVQILTCKSSWCQISEGEFVGEKFLIRDSK